MEINRSQEAMASRRARRRKRRHAGLLLNIHEFANILIKNGGEVPSINAFLSDHGVDGVDFNCFDSRIALLETKTGATENKFEPTYHCITQVLSHKHDKKKGQHFWETQAWNLSGGKATNGVYFNDPEDIFLLPAHRSTITYGKGTNRKRYQVDYNLNAGQVKLDPVDDNSNSPREKRSKTNRKNDSQTQSKVKAKTPDTNSKKPKRKSKSQSNSKKGIDNPRTPRSNTSTREKKRLSSARRRSSHNKNAAHANTALDTPKSTRKNKYVYDCHMRDSYMAITCVTHI